MLLYYLPKKNSIPESTLKEIERLNPEGLFVDGNVKVILIGDMGAEIKNTLNKKKFKIQAYKRERCL